MKIEDNNEGHLLLQGDTGDSIFGRLSNVVKSKSTEMKEKLSNYIKNDQIAEERHISNTDRVGKRYRNMASVFTIGDEDEGMVLMLIVQTVKIYLISNL
jgi:spore maturation protein CgeB